MRMTRIWVTGATGLIGSRVCKTLPQVLPDSVPIPLGREKVDLTDEKALTDYFRQNRPDAIIHCAALSRGPACHQNPVLAEQTNVVATLSLSRLAEKIPLIHFSTDLVFDGRKGNYDEEDKPNPLGVYAETKAKAEAAVMQNPSHTVVRTSLNAGISPSRKNLSFLEELASQWICGRQTNLFEDEYRSPIAVESTSRLVCQVLAHRLTGVYHLAGNERLSRYEIGELIAHRLKISQTLLVKTSLKDYQGPPRPPDTSLNVKKIQDALNLTVPSFQEWVASSKELDQLMIQTQAT